MEFINGLAWVIAVIGWPLGLLAVYWDFEAFQRTGNSNNYAWGRILSAAIVATVWLVTM